MLFTYPGNCIAQFLLQKRWDLDSWIGNNGRILVRLGQAESGREGELNILHFDW